MDLSSLALVVAILSSLPAVVALLGILLHRPFSEAWIRRHARGFGWVAVVGWGVVSLRRWLAPDGYFHLAFAASVGAMLCMVAFAIHRSGDVETRC